MNIFKPNKLKQHNVISKMRWKDEVAYVYLTIYKVDNHRAMHRVKVLVKVVSLVQGLALLAVQEEDQVQEEVLLDQAQEEVPLVLEEASVQDNLSLDRDSDILNGFSIRHDKNRSVQLTLHIQKVAQFTKALTQN